MAANGFRNVQVGFHALPETHVYTNPVVRRLACREDLRRIGNATFATRLAGEFLRMLVPFATTPTTPDTPVTYRDDVLRNAVNDYHRSADNVWWTKADQFLAGVDTVDKRIEYAMDGHQYRAWLWTEMMYALGGHKNTLLRLMSDPEMDNAVVTLYALLLKDVVKPRDLVLARHNDANIVIERVVDAAATAMLTACIGETIPVTNVDSYIPSGWDGDSARAKHPYVLDGMLRVFGALDDAHIDRLMIPLGAIQRNDDFRGDTLADPDSQHKAYGLQVVSNSTPENDIDTEKMHVLAEVYSTTETVWRVRMNLSVQIHRTNGSILWYVRNTVVLVADDKAAHIYTGSILNLVMRNLLELMFIRRQMRSFVTGETSVFDLPGCVDGIEWLATEAHWCPKVVTT